jgi:hypothetical protein
MDMQFTPNYIPENAPNIKQPGTEPQPERHTNSTDTHYERIQQELHDAGVSWYGMVMMESRYLPRIIHNDESIKGVVYGWQPLGMVMLVATNHRLIFLDKKPFYLRDDEVGYDSVRGISYYHAGLTSSIILHTQVQDYMIRTFNKDCLQKFIDYVELRSFEHKDEEGLRDDSTERERTVQVDRDETSY